MTPGTALIMSGLIILTGMLAGYNASYMAKQPPHDADVACARIQMVPVMSEGVWRCARADALVDVK